MRFFLDHDVPAEIGRVLRQAGHDIRTVADLLSPTASDEEVLDCAIAQGRILVTCNRDDFLQLVAGREHSGLIVLVRRRTRIAECSAIIRLLERAGGSGTDGNVNFA